MVDLVQRFSQTLLTAVLPIQGVLVRAATNNQLLLDRLRAESKACGGEKEVVNWRIVVEEKGEPLNEEFALHSLKHDGLSVIRIATESFMAGDQQTRSCISFVTSDLIREKRLFGQYFLPNFLSILEDMKEKKWNRS